MEAAHTTYQYGAYAKRSGYCRLEAALAQCAVLYNAALEERRQAHRMSGASVSLYDQTKQFTGVRKDDPDGRGSLSVKLGRGVLMRTDRAMNIEVRPSEALRRVGTPFFGTPFFGTSPRMPNRAECRREMRPMSSLLDNSL